MERVKLVPAHHRLNGYACGTAVNCFSGSSGHHVATNRRFMDGGLLESRVPHTAGISTLFYRLDPRQCFADADSRVLQALRKQSDLTAQWERDAREITVQ